ncbi:hypothetical protein [Streptomonospora litoralis]|uniref:hypothetical protein n=1 Tax=Streptomonospora litoralis TaxID=2498135 RepID=UPI0010365E9B|nr:hypothetical protein [Streptomonospora litoralis]
MSAIPALLALAVLALLPGEASADGEKAVTPAEHYAELLAEEPEGAAVAVDGAIGGALEPEEMTDDLHTVFGGLGLPYYVVVSPFLGWGAEIAEGKIAASLHDRLGADGLYVVLEPQGRALEVEAYGVDADTETALHVALTHPELPYDAPATEVAGVIVDALKDPSIADELRAERETFWLLREETWADLHPSGPDGPESLGFLLGAVGGAAVAVGGWGAWRLARHRRSGRATTVGLSAVVVAAGVVIAPGAWVAAAPVADYEKPDPEDVARTQPPYVVSTARAAHIAEELGEDPLYVDPLLQLPRAGLDEEAAEFGGAPVPVYAAVVPLSSNDESGGDHEVLAAAVASLAEREGVYLVVGRGIGDTVSVGAAAHGLKTGYSLDSEMYEADADNPAAALRKAVAALDEVDFASGGTYIPGFADSEPGTPEPRMVRYWGEGVALGFLVYGLFVAPAAIAGVWLGLYGFRVWRGGGRVVGDSVLRRLAQREAERLRALLARREGGFPEELLPQADAALLTLDAQPRTLDMLGVVVLARRLLAEAEEPAATRREPCAVNPLHPWATERGRPRERSGSRPRVCVRCAQLSPEARSARVLRLRSRTTAHAYNSHPADPWIRYRFGADDPAAMVEALLKEQHVS